MFRAKSGEGKSKKPETNVGAINVQNLQSEVKRAQEIQSLAEPLTNSESDINTQLQNKIDELTKRL